MITKKEKIANAIKESVDIFNRLVKQANEINLVVKFTNNESSLGYCENLYKVDVYEIVMY